MYIVSLDMVRIEGTYRMESDSLAKAKAKDTAKKADSASGSKKGSAAEKDIEIVSTYKSLIRQAASCKEVDKKAVAQAKSLLASGELDTAQTVRLAAETILGRGIC